MYRESTWLISPLFAVFRDAATGAFQERGTIWVFQVQDTLIKSHRSLCQSASQDSALSSRTPCQQDRPCP